MSHLCRPRARGQELIEYALTLPLLVLLIFGVVDLGRVVYFYSLIYNGAREGARYGAVHPYDSTGIRNAVLQITAGLDPTVLNTQIVFHDFDPNGGEQTCQVGQTICPDTIQVTVSYPFEIVTPLIAAFFPSSTLTLISSSNMQVEH